MKILLTYTLLISLFIFSCNDEPALENKNNTQGLRQPVLTKPVASFQDTLRVDFPAAIFYQPDSLQLEKIRTITDPSVYDATMHEYFFQMKNARRSIIRDWPELRIVEAKNIRFLFFRGKGDDSSYIDLDTSNDPYGLFLFHPSKKPHVADMMNIDTELGFYFKK